MTQDVVQVIDAESFSAVTGVSRETMERLVRYEELLRKWQPSINLVSAATLTDLWRRHMLDSAQLVELAPKEAKLWVDLGSGGGFPGLVVAILLRDRPGFRLHAVESDQRKAVFLREVARQTGAPVTVHAQRIESFVPGFGEGAVDVISARALAPLDRLLKWSESLWDDRTVGLFLKGKTVRDELTEAAKEWIFEFQAITSQSDPSGTVLKLWGLHGTNPGNSSRQILD